MPPGIRILPASCARILPTGAFPPPRFRGIIAPPTRRDDASRTTGGSTWLLTTHCARSCRSPAWSEERARTVEITGGADPILPTPFRIGETSAAALAATGLAVSDLWELRTGRKQEVAVDLRQATASLRSGHYLKMEKAEVSRERNPVMGMYPAKNGRWSYIHANFPNHRAAALKVLGVPRRPRRRCARRWRSGTRSNSRRRSSPPRAPAAWCAPWTNGRSTRRPRRSPRCR